MARLAWFTPLPPTRSGIARYSAEILASLQRTRAHEIDVYVEKGPESFTAPSPGVRLFPAHDFVWRHGRDPYDLTIYQLGNAPYHDYMWAYLTHYPGLVVLHDGQLHHSRARLLLQQRRHDDYRREFWFNHPDARKDLAELGAAGLLGSLTRLWPMLRVVLDASRAVAVHNRWLAEEIEASHPGCRVGVIEMGVPAATIKAGARERIRARHQIPLDAVVFTALGKVTPEKRIRETLQALATLGAGGRNAHLLLAGESVDYYDLRTEARALGVDAKTTFAGYAADEEIDDYLAASDVCVCMRWPTSRETSASWLRCLAGGKPTIVTDLVHTGDVPTLDPRNWSVLSTANDERPVGVSIDLLDEGHSLRLAMTRLADDARLRDTLGANARALWADRFDIVRMRTAYEQAITGALAAPPPDAQRRRGLPAHLRSGGTEYAERILRDAGFPGDVDVSL